MKSHLTPFCLSLKLQSSLPTQGVQKLKVSSCSLPLTISSATFYNHIEMLESSVQPASNNNNNKIKTTKNNNQKTHNQPKTKSKSSRTKKRKPDLGL